MSLALGNGNEVDNIMTLTLGLSILASVISVLSFIFNRKDKSNKDTSASSYNQGVLDTQLKNIFDKLNKIEAKLDTYEEKIDEKIDKKMAEHIKVYHKGA